MKEYICKICEKTFKSNSALGGHSSSHSKKQKEWYKKMSLENTLKRVKIKKICKKCGTEFEAERTLNKDGTQRIPKFEKTYCSRSCANGHKHTEETKKKMSKSLTGNIPWNKGKYFKLKIPKFCKKCGIKIGSDNQYGLCNVCVRSKKEIRNKISKTIKEQYKNGKKVFGGKTKWLKYKDFKVQGTYELRACFILDEMLERKEINNWEYTNDRIKYIGEDEKEHYYLLDFKINNDYYIETKGYTSKKDILKWKEAENQNIKIVKWFLEDIEKEEDRLSIIHGVGSVNG